MIDSFGKIPSGILMGSFYEFGNFDECLNVSHDTKDKDIGVINGQYCLPPIKFKSNSPERSGNGMAGLPMSLNVGVCFPDTCSPSTIKNTLEILLSRYNLTIGDSNLELLCTTNQIEELNGFDIFVIVFFCIVASLLLLSTIYDILTKYFKKNQIPLLLAFSVLTNGSKILSCVNSKSPDVMNCLNGIRVLSIVWVVYAHAYLVYLYGPIINFLDVPDWAKRTSSAAIMSATVSVDTFFLLSGLLVTWSVLKELNKNKKMNIFIMYVHRYLRLTPPLAVLLLFIVTFLKNSGSGPLFKSINNVMYGACDKYWWSLLIYTQNYVNPKEMCLGHSWYLSVDMQLFILSPLILYPLWKFGKKFLIPIILLIGLAMGCAFTTIYINDYNKGMFDVDVVERQRLIYFPTHIRMHAWLVGVILGYILYNFHKKEIRLPNIVMMIGWILSLTTILAIIYGPTDLYDMKKEAPLLDQAFYESFSRVTWCIALSWIIFACVKGYGGYVNSFLSLPYWLPFARLSYCMYLLHFVIQFLKITTIRTNIYFSDMSVAFAFWGDFGISLTVSFIWCLAFESPIVTLEKYLFKRSPPSSKKLENEIDNNYNNNKTPIHNI